MKTRIAVLLAGVLVISGLAWAMPPLPGNALPQWVADAKTQGMDSPKDGLIQQLRTKDPKAKISGSRSYPVIMGYFSDTSFTYSQLDFQTMLFSSGSGVKSVNNYYRDMSYNAMSCSGSVASWANSGNTVAYFGNGNNGLTTSDTIQSAYGFIKKTLLACDAAVDFSDPAYDLNGDGYVDVLWVVHAGRGGEEATVNDIWSHSWQLTYWRSGTGKIFTTNDPRPGYAGQFMKIDKYIIMPEKTLYSGESNNMIGCGVFAHEFGHALGLPDLYDTGGSLAGYGLGLFSLMAAGSWGGNYASGARPVALDLWCRRFLGWASPTLVPNDNQYTVNSIMASNVGSSYKLSKLGADTTKQYWLVENRYKNAPGAFSTVKWDSLLKGQGLAIYHIDSNYTTTTYLNNNNVNRNSTTGSSRDRPLGVALEETDMTTAGYSSELWYGNNAGEAVDIWNSGNQANFDSNGTAYPVSYYNGVNSTTGGAHSLVAIRAIPAASAAMTCSMFVGVAPAGVDGRPEGGIPAAFALQNAWPNPARGQVNFRYQLPQTVRVELKVYNVLGQEVKSFRPGIQEAGQHSVRWSEDEMSEGVYFVRLQAGDQQATRKFIVVK